MTLETVTFDSGLQCLVEDWTIRYFGDYHHVRLLLTFSFPLTESILPEGESLDQLSRLMGPTISFQRTLSRMGVPTANLESVKRDLLDHFSRTATPYIQHPDYLRQYLRRRLDEKRRGVSFP